jgi:demethylmenaquinone methyltransferase/2-methoxy-6-polyprenyl-1,4-benzoquinol methylase
MTSKTSATIEQDVKIHASPTDRPVDARQIAAMFDRVAPKYDFLNALLSLRQDQRWRNRLVSLIPYKPAGSLLDVATGTGDVLFTALANRTEYKSFTGVDISGEMLTLAEAKSKQRPASDLCRFQTMSAERLEFADGTFDCVTISFGIRNVVDKEKALSEFCRVLKPSGTLIIMEFFTPRSSLVAKAFSIYFHHILPVIGGIFSDRSAYTYLPRSVATFYSPDQLRGALYRAGFLVNHEVPLLLGGCRIIQAKKIG